ncbi:carbohydrate ABC transporter permease [Cohnella thailandensis]|uniref:Carbohydrate ABC transporter permease n=1 Tax=Cohnella thailandensis TaxID=557557 RepID=A0A841SZP2_9BACL|nr:carbohydrate ABC transporter permease [Cohnella thailandensis]MBB6636329.1 carbohydrate ABC transporter permease [Cohnella thailandensis]MBP1973701.1 putative aldouronate transport system permease protein [Cohnella thailandensis]
MNSLTTQTPVPPRRKRRSKGIRRSWPEKLFDVCNYALFALIGLSTLLPFVNLLAKSLSSEEAVFAGRVGLLPIDLQFGTYRYVLEDEAFMGALRVSVLLTVLGTACSLLVTTLTAYPLSKPRLVGRKWLLLLFIFTMLFGGGLIPTYLLMHNLHLVNTLSVLFLPSMVNVFNMLVIKNYFEGLPDSLEESAKLDGAGHIRILLFIYLPLSLPVLATIALFFAVAFWNDYFNAMIYISNPSLKPLQLFLKELLVSSSDFLRNATMNPDQALNTAPQSIQAASIILATVPILVVYPFLQKYFVKGVLVGSVKE